MLNVNNFSDVLIKIVLLALAVFIFLAASVAFGNVVFGVLAGAFYIYEVARI